MVQVWQSPSPGVGLQVGGSQPVLEVRQRVEAGDTQGPQEELTRGRLQDLQGELYQVRVCLQQLVGVSAATGGCV